MNLLTYAKTSKILITRNKKHLTLITFLPLLVLIIATVMMDTGTKTASLGFSGHIAEPSTKNLIQTLNRHGITTHPYDDSKSCITSVYEGIHPGCLSFNYANNPSATLTLDSTRQISERLKPIVETAVAEYSGNASNERANTYKNRLQKAQEEIKTAQESLVAFATQQDSLNKQLENAKLQLGKLNYQVDMKLPVDIENRIQTSAILGMSETVNTIKKSVDNEYRRTIETVKKQLLTSAISDNDRIRIIQELDDSEAQMTEITDTFTVTGKLTQQDLIELRDLVKTLGAHLGSVKEELLTLQGISDNTRNQISDVQEQIQQNIQSLLSIQKSFNTIYELSKAGTNQNTFPLTVKEIGNKDLLTQTLPIMMIVMLVGLGSVLAIHLHYAHTQGQVHHRNHGLPGSEGGIILVVSGILFIEGLILLGFGNLLGHYPLWNIVNYVFGLVFLSIIPPLLGIIVGRFYQHETYALLGSGFLIFILVTFSPFLTTTEMIHPTLQWIMHYNPVTLLIEIARRSLILGVSPLTQISMYFWLLGETILLGIFLIIQQKVRKDW